MKIRYSPAAMEDLRELRGYLVSEFGPAVAAESMGRIVADISSLKRFPALMRPLSDKISRPSAYSYFLCGKYSIAILVVGNGVISVVRILDGRTDYATTVFGMEKECLK